jgi:hypothetical protein
MTPPQPHEQVYVRLGLSPIHGVGVFAIRQIPEGMNIFANDRVGIVWIEKEHLADAGLTQAERSLYEDFAIHKGDSFGCPVNFHNLTPGWYLNEPAPGHEPNVASDAQFNFFALRDIAPGEELTIRYTDFSTASPSPADDGLTRPS